MTRAVYLIGTTLCVAGLIAVAFAFVAALVIFGLDLMVGSQLHQGIRSVIGAGLLGLAAMVVGGLTAGLADA